MFQIDNLYVSGVSGLWQIVFDYIWLNEYLVYGKSSVASGGWPFGRGNSHDDESMTN